MLTYERYAELRDAKNMTDYQMSQLTGVSKATFSVWKQRRNPPRVENLLKIAKVLKIPPSTLISREDIKAAKLPGEDNG